ncbi:MAG: DUF2089 family protein [Cyclobacteriaceae bacterium]
MKKRIPASCPSCDHMLNVTSLECPDCRTTVNGDYKLPLMTSLSQEEQNFILDFFKESGKLNLMAKHLNMSYPTLRNKLDDLIEKIKGLEKELKNSEDDEG